MAIAFKDAMKVWQSGGTIGVKENIVAEPTVDATFRVVEAINQAIGLNNATADLATGVKSLIKQNEAGDYVVDMYIRFEGSQKQFEFAVFVNGVETDIVINDKAQGSTAVAPCVSLPANAVLDLRQRSTDGGTVLIVHYCGLTVVRAT